MRRTRTPLSGCLWVSSLTVCLLPAWFICMLTAGCGVTGSSSGSTAPPLPPAPSVASVVVTPQAATTPLGESQPFTAAAKDANGNPISGATFTWSSDRPRIATVDSTGKATGIGLGAARISATSAGVSGSGILTVSENLTRKVIPTNFFGMTTVDAADFPRVPAGALGHPPRLAWGWIEQTKGVYTWTYFDDFVNAAERNGVDLVITFGWTPGWAAKDQSTCSPVSGVSLCTSPPTYLQDWKNFLNQVISHYNGVTAPHVKYYELWNEANSKSYWSGTVLDMVSLAEAAYPIIHQDPNSLLLTPSVGGPVGTADPSSGETWMAQYLAAGGRLYADGGTFHGYIARTGVRPYPMPEQDTTSGCVAFTTCFGSIVTKAMRMRAVFDANGLAGKPMFDTEGSWGDNNVTDPDAQAAWLARWYLLQAGNNVQRVYWYAWGGGRAFAEVPYGQVYKWLVGATPSTACSPDSASTWTCAFTRPGDYEALGVWNANGPTSFLPAPQFKQYRDLQGSVFPFTAGAMVPIGIKPILLETGNVPP